MTRQLRLLVAAATVAFVGYGLIDWYRNTKAEAQLLAFRELVLKTEQGEDVALVFSSKQFDLLTLERSAAGWLVSTPLAFGASNWVLHIEVHDSLITAVKVRSRDNYDQHPPQAPPDVTRGGKSSAKPIRSDRPWLHGRHNGGRQAEDRVPQPHWKQPRGPALAQMGASSVRLLSRCPDRWRSRAS
jgi:hypothetical protein